MKLKAINAIIRSTALAVVAMTTGAQASVSLTNGSFENTSALILNAIGGLYQPSDWVNLTVGAAWEASSSVAGNPPNGEWTPAPGSATGSRALRLVTDGSANVGAEAQVVGTMQSGHTYYLTADVFGGPVTPYRCRIGFVNEPSVTPASEYSVLDVGPIGNGSKVPVNLSYTAQAADEGLPLTVLLKAGPVSVGGGNYYGHVDNVQLSDNVPVAPYITAQPTGGASAAGLSFSTGVTAGGSGDLTYQWFKGSGVLAGETNATLSISPLAVPNAGDYTVVVANGGGSVTSSVARLSVSPFSFVNGSFESTDALLLNAIGGLYQPSGWTSLTVGVSFEGSSAVAANPPNGEWTAAAGSANGSRALRLVTDTAANVGAQAQGLGVMQANHTYFVTADVYGGPNDPYQCQIALVSEASTTPATTYSNLLVGPIANREIRSVSLSYTAQAADEGNPLVILLLAGPASVGGGSYYGHVDHVQVTDNTPIPAYIAVQPVSVTNSLGSSSTLSVVGGGTEAAYQWFKDASPVSGATAGTLSHSPVTLADAGNYSVVVTAGGSSVTSSVVSLTVQAFPVAITRQPGPSSSELLAGAPYSLSVGVTNNAALPITYQWYKGASALAGETNSSYSISGVTAADAGSYTVVVANPANVVTSTPAAFVIGTLPGSITRYQTAIRSESSLLSEYTFDLGNAADSVGVNHGSVTNCSFANNGLAGGANLSLVLNGTGLASLGAVPDFEFASGSGTVETWVRADWSPSNDGKEPWAPIAVNPCLMRCGSSGEPTVRWSIHLSQDKSQLIYWNGSAPALVPIPAPGTFWHHLAVVFDAGTLTVYWDNVPVVRSIALGAGSGVVTQIGASDSTYPFPGFGSYPREGWLGAFDEFAIYGAALSPAQITAHYDAFSAGSTPQVLSSPRSVVVFPGEPVSLSASISGAGLSLQWFKNGAAISGANGATLTLPALAPGDAGRYHVRAINTLGTTNTADALVTVASPDSLRLQRTIQSQAGVLAFYPFDSDDFSDVIGGHNGAQGSGNITAVTFEPGLGGGSDRGILFDQGSYVSLGSVDSFQMTNGVGSVEAWVRADWASDSLTVGDPYVLACRDGNGTKWALRMIQHKGLMGIITSAGTTFSAIPDPGTNWHHLVAVFDVVAGTNTAAVYWDDAKITSVNGGPGTNEGVTTQIGNGLPVTLSSPWVGGIDNVAFYSKALTPGEVNAHYAAMVGLNISMSRSGSDLNLSWPASTPGSVLESASQITGPWTAVPGVDGNRATVSAGAGVRFFRIHLK